MRILGALTGLVMVLLSVLEVRSMADIIRTRYFGPSDTRQARIRASCKNDSVTIPFNYRLSIEENNRAAAEALCQKMEWNCENIVGAELDAQGYLFIHDPK